MFVLGLIVYVVCNVIGYLVGNLVPTGTWTPYVPLMVSYHLLLIFVLVYLWATDKQKIGFSVHPVMTVITHAAFLGALIGVVMGRHYVPFFSFVRYLVPSLAPFEAKWLFEGKSEQRAEPEHQSMPEGTLQDYDDFQQYLREKHRRFMKPGRSVREEYVVWMAHRGKRHVATRSPIDV